MLYVQHGVRAGGTRGVLNPTLARLYHEPGLRALLARRDFNDLRKSAMETFFEIVPPEHVADRDVQEHRYQIRGHAGTSTVYFSGLKDVGGLGSQEFGLIVLHEVQEMTYDMYRRIKPRASQSGFSPMILMEGNPPFTGDWLDQLLDESSRLYDPDVTRLILPTSENWENLDAGFRASMERTDAAFKRRFLLGLSGFLPSGTPVYPSFVEAVHVRETHLVPDRPIIRGWDFGLRKAACVWGQRTDRGQFLWHREWMAHETPETQFIDGVIQRTLEWFGPRTCQDFGDPAATQRDPEGKSTLQRLVDKGITLRYRVTTYGERIPLINRRLCELIDGQSAEIIDPRCQILIEGLHGGYHYPELIAGQEFTQKRDLPQRDGYFEHLANAWEYAHVNLLLSPSSIVEKMRLKQRQQDARMRRQQTSVVF